MTTKVGNQYLVTRNLSFLIIPKVEDTGFHDLFKVTRKKY